MANNIQSRLLEEAVRKRDICSAKILNPEEIELITFKRVRADWQLKTNIPDAIGLRVLEMLEPKTIKIKFIHLVDPQTGIGYVTAARRKKLIKVLNKSFLSSGIQFKTHKFQYIFNSQFCFDMEDPNTEQIVKQNYHASPDHYLNIYTADLSSVLGWATFPTEYMTAGNLIRWMDGVVVWHGVFPDSNHPQFNLGKRVVHEIGHWLGLLHTFHDGCRGNGDDITDTPAHRIANLGVPPAGESNGACNLMEQAPIRNFMNYTDDVVMDHFTPEQIEKMRKVIEIFRPNL